MNPTAIYSKTGKGVQEASGKTSQLSRGDRAILSAIDGKVNLKDLSAKFDRAADDKFFALIKKMDADGFIREVNPGVAQRGAANAPKPATPAKAAGGAGEELDFTQIFSAPPKQEKSPASAAPAGDAMAQARHEAEMRQRAERDAKTKAEAAAKAMAEMAMKERSDAEARAKAAREATMQAAAEGKTKAEIEARTLAEARAKADADRQAKERAERDAREAKERAEHGVRDKAEAAEKARRDAADRARREADDLRRKVEEERRAREEAERRAREEAERTKREAEERARRDAEEKKSRQEAEELRQKLDEERKAREEAERKAQEEREKREREREAEDRRVLEEQEKRDAERRVQEQAERKERDERDRREQEENQRQIRLAREAEDRKRRDADARKKKEQDAKRWEQEDARRKSDGAYRVRAELEDKERAEREAVESVERAQAEKKAAEAADALAGSLMVDLDSFSKREEEERKEREQNERKQRAEEQRRAKEDEARHEREETERRVRKEEDKRRKEEEEHRQKEQKEAAEREAEAKAKEEEAERKKKKREAEARKAESGDIPISSADLGRDDISDDERKLTPEARKALRDREREVGRARSRGDQTSAKAASAYRRKQPVKWGKPVALALFFLLVGGVGVVNFLPLSTGEYEKLATDAIGHPVKIGSARMWVLAGVQMRFERVSIGETIRIAEVRAVPELGALLDENKAFSRIEMDKVTLPQESLGALFGAMQGSRLRVARVVAKEVKLVGPLALPTVDFDAAIGSDGRVNSVRLSGERISGLITPKGDDVAFEATLGTFTIPFIDKLSVSEFGMKGSANRRGMTLSEFDGRLYDGLVVGKGRIQWGAQWSVQGEIQGKAMNAAVFSPQMISEGRFDGKGRFTLAGPDPAKLAEGARLEGTFTVAKGALSSFDLSRALQSTSAQASGRTQFSALEGSAALANGALALRDLKLTAGILNANGTLDVDAAGGLSGRVNAELRNLRGTFYIGGKLQEPQLRR